MPGQGQTTLSNQRAYGYGQIAATVANIAGQAFRSYNKRQRTESANDMPNGIVSRYHEGNTLYHKRKLSARKIRKQQRFGALVDKINNWQAPNNFLFRNGGGYIASTNGTLAVDGAATANQQVLATFLYPFNAADVGTLTNDDIKVIYTNVIATSSEQPSTAGVIDATTNSGLKVNFESAVMDVQLTLEEVGGGGRECWLGIYEVQTRMDGSTAATLDQQLDNTVIPLTTTNVPAYTEWGVSLFECPNFVQNWQILSYREQLVATNSQVSLQLKDTRNHKLDISEAVWESTQGVAMGFKNWTKGYIFVASGPIHDNSTGTPSVAGAKLTIAASKRYTYNLEHPMARGIGFF